MRNHRIVLVVSLLAFGLALSACSTFDPTEWFSQKKPLPGERKAVFPEGVPGVPEGVPPELVQGYVPPTEPVPEPRVIEEKPKPKAKPKAKPRPQQAAAPPRQMMPVASAPPQQAQPARAGAWPEASPAPAQPAPAQTSSPFPDPPRR
jgi:hypothetical protein